MLTMTSMSSLTPVGPFAAALLGQATAQDVTPQPESAALSQIQSDELRRSADMVAAIAVRLRHQGRAASSPHVRVLGRMAVKVAATRGDLDPGAEPSSP